MDSTRLGRLLLVGVVVLGTALAAILPMIHSTVVVTHSGDATVFRYTHWLPMLIGALGVSFFLITLGLVAVGRARGRLLLLSSLMLLAALGLAIGIFHDKVSVDRDAFTINAGSFLDTKTLHVPYAELTHIEIYSEVVPDGRTQKTIYYMTCYRKEGGSERIEINDLMQAAAEAKILQVARAHRIRVEDRTGRW